MAKILALDDVLDDVKLIKQILERKGHTVIPFTDEEDAIEYMASHHVDLAILEIKLKRMNGVEVLEEMKKKNPALKVIMLTGYPTIETARECITLGACEYCVKPIDKDELEETVAQALKQS